MIAEAFQLGVVLSLVDNASSGLNKIKGAVHSMKGEFEGVGKAMDQFHRGGQLLKGTAAASAALIPLVNEASKFESALSGLQAVSSATTDEMNRFKAAAIDAGIKTQFSPDQAVEGLTALAATGFSATESIQNLLPVLDYAAAAGGKLSMDSAASAIASTVKVFEESANHVADVYTTMSNISSFRPEEMQATWAGVNQVQAQANQSIESMAAVLSALKNSGQTAVGSGEKLRMAVNALITPSGNARKELERLGVDVYDKTSGKFRDIINIFQDLESATASLSEEERNKRLSTILMTEGMAAFNAVSSTGIGQVKEWTEQFRTADGAVRKFAETQQNNLRGALTRMQGSISTLAVLLGTALLPALATVTERFTELLFPILKWLQTHPEITNWIMGVTLASIAVLGLSSVASFAMGAIHGLTAAIAIARTTSLGYAVAETLAALATGNLSGAAAGASLVLEALGVTQTATAVKSYVLSAAQWVLSGGFLAVATAAWSFTAAILANPLTWVVVGVVALIGSLVALVYYWDTVKAAVVSAVTTIYQYTVGVWNRIKSAWSEAPAWVRGLVAVVVAVLFPIPAAIAAIGVVIYKNWDAISEYLTSAWNTIKSTASSIWSGIVDRLSSVWESITGPAAVVYEYLSGWAGRIYEAITGGLGMIQEWLSGVWNTIWDGFLGVVVNAGLGFVQALWSGIKANASILWDGVKGILSEVGNYLPHSDAKKGPLSTLTASGRSVVQTFTGGMEQHAPTLYQSVSALLDGLTFNIPAPEFAGLGAGTISPLNQSMQSMFRIDIENLVGELHYDGRTESGRMIDFDLLVNQAIQRQIDKAAKNGENS